MITIFHGDNQADSRQAFLKRKQKNPSTVTLQAGIFTLTDLVQICNGGELFSKPTVIAIEDLFRKLKQTRELKAIAQYINQQKSSCNFLLWEGSTLEKNQLSLFPDAEVVIFRLPQSLFAFLESIAPQNSLKSIKLFHQTLAVTDPEIILAMLIRQLRLLIALKESSPIEEITKLALWQKERLTRQAELFSKDDLKLLYHYLFTVDQQRKTGTVKLPLISSIDFFLLKLYH